MTIGRKEFFELLELSRETKEAQDEMINFYRDFIRRLIPFVEALIQGEEFPTELLEKLLERLKMLSE